MTKEDLGKSLLISSKTAGMDPRVNYRQWLRNTLHAVLEDAIEGDESAKNFLKTALGSLILWSDEERIKIILTGLLTIKIKYFFGTDLHMLTTLYGKITRL